ncbi:thioredoxin domain-containing protein [Desulfoferrobacter suflitae]|uniref:thioredoxin domain-containing protein n=1 Tax=Desulfoferrobacter suflitae TaxID=2865782 RepID=UPI0021640F8E|nr:thioredoxin domain-containing protein [Desulfoferrobacter suflitae]MCK8603361.1 thioredoxin domain-containing protein [Desulfoferrobacter suflitae]
MSNRLSQEKSPYLLQHADNPVNWFPWKGEAFKKALDEDKPVFLSVGYATCHWCHVMEHESFEDEEVAQVLNENFISIKVDREERPDIDQIYMSVCQALTGRGGWPLSIFMTPERKPFYAGTYFPRNSRMGMPGFVDVLRQIAGLWKSNRERALDAAEQITAAIQPKSAVQAGPAVDLAVLEKGYRQLNAAFDSQWGGFGSAPKFPTPHQLTFLLRWHRRKPDSQALAMVEKTLDAMRCGGIFDHLGFGFARYSVDERWFAPHFEKMLYDQAMLAMAYLEAYQVTGRERYAGVAKEIFEYVLRDMTDSGGAFYSAEDADSEGVEGLFYLWTPRQLKDVLGAERGDLLCRYYDVTEAGNFEHGRSILHVPKPPHVFAQVVGMDRVALERLLEECRQELFHAREKRIHPLKDDKILTSWNGLMIVALAKGYRAVGDERYLKAAGNAAEFILRELRLDSGRLFRRFREGEVANPGYMDDYAFMVWAFIELYESTFDVGCLERAVQLNRQALDLFWDEKEGGFFYTAQDSESLIIRDKEIYDGAVPSSNSVAALNLLRLARLTGDAVLEDRADRLLQRFSAMIADYPSAYTQFLNAVDFVLGPAQEVVIAGDLENPRTRTMVELLHRTFSPNRVVLVKDGGEQGDRLAALSHYVGAMKSKGGEPLAYICENFACQAPSADIETLKLKIG